MDDFDQCNLLVLVSLNGSFELSVFLKNLDCLVVGPGVPTWIWLHNATCDRFVLDLLGRS